MEDTYSPKGNIHGPILPQFILQKALSLGAKVMYAILCDYAGKTDHCWPSQNTLAKQLSCSLTSVKKYLGELVNEKLITVRKENYRSSVYYLLRPVASHSSMPTENSSARQPISGYAQSNSDHIQSDSGYLNTLNNQKRNTLLIPPGQETKKCLPQSRRNGVSAPVAREVGASLSDFETVWKFYPRKQALGFARRIWVKLHKNNRLPPLEKIIAAIKWFADTPGWQREEGRYIPQLGKWLQDERWLDEAFESASIPQDKAQDLKQRQILAHLEARKRAREKESEEKAAKLRPIFNAFISRFADAERMRGPAWGFWNLLYAKGKAPRAEHVPQDNTLGVLNYLKLFQAA